MDEAKAPKIVHIKPPYALEEWRDTITSGTEGHLFQVLKNLKIDRNSLYVRAGITRQCPTAVVAATEVKAIYKATYVDGTSMLFASVGTGLYYFHVGDDVWKALTLQDNITLSVSDDGTFQHYNDKTYFTNGIESIMQIRGGTDLDVHKAGLPDPNAKLDINLFESLSDWVKTGAAGASSLDTASRHYVQGSGGILFTVNDNSTVYWTYTPSSALDLTAYEDGVTAGVNAYVSFSAFRGIKASIGLFTVELETSTNNYYKGIVYDDPGSVIWDIQQQSLSALWANDPDDNKMFLVKLRKNWFEAVGSPDWSNITKVRISIKGANQVSATALAAITMDYLRLEQSAPIALPLHRLISDCERGSGWTGSGVTWVTWWSSTGIACLSINAGSTATLIGTWDFTTFPGGKAITATDCLSMDIGGPGNTSKSITVSVSDGLVTATYIYGLLAALMGGGVRMQLPLAPALWTNGGTINWAAITSISILSTGSLSYVDNIRIEPGRVQKVVDKFQAVDLKTLALAAEVVDPFITDMPLLTLFGSAAYQWYHQWKYQTFGTDGYMIYPDYDHGANKPQRTGYRHIDHIFGGCTMTLNTSGGNTFGVFVNRTLVPLDLNNQVMWAPHAAPFVWSPQEGEYGFASNYNVAIDDDDEFEIWMACPDFRTLRSVEFKFYKDSASSGAPVKDGDNYWTYTMDSATIAQLLLSIEGRRLQEEAKNKPREKGSGRNRWERDNNGEQTAADFYLQQITADESNVITNADQGNVTYLGTEGIVNKASDFERENWEVVESQGSRGWHRILLRWKMGDLIPTYPSSEGSKSRIAGYEITITAMEGASCSVAFDDWTIRKTGALNGTYFYKTVLVDEDGFESAPSDASLQCRCNNADVSVENIYDASSDSRVKAKYILRLGGTVPEWAKVMELPPGITSFEDKLEDSKAITWDSNFTYAPPKAKIMQILDNYTWYLNITDRFNRVRPSRLQRSEPFAPFQCKDEYALDIRPEDGTVLTGIVEHLTSIVVTKDTSIWTIEPTLERPAVCRMNSIGCIATQTLHSTPYELIGLSREGMFLGDTNSVSPTFGRPIWETLQGVALSTQRQAVGIYLGESYFLFVSGFGWGCYLPEKRWYQLDGLTVTASGFDDNQILYGGTDGFINNMFVGDTDLGSPITSELRTQEFVGEVITLKDVLRRLCILAKKVTTSTLTVTPYVDQVAGTAVAKSPSTTTYQLIKVPFEQGTEGHSLSIKITGSGRYTINRMDLEIKRRDPRV